MKSFIVSRLLFESRKSEKNYFLSFWNNDKMIDHRINHIFDEKTSFRVELDNHSHVLVSIQSINWRRFILFNIFNSESKHIKHRINFINLDF
jgi:hypothetical protein